MLLQNAFLTEHDYYEIMGLTPAATQVEVEEAFKQQSANLNLRHPLEAERIKSAERMLLLTQAFEALSNPILRSHYDIQILGRHNLPVTEKVDILFKEGIRAWRKQETDLALRYLKEVAHLYPHRALYRVHLAIAYAEKEWMTFTESELETALRLDPDFNFAKETVAKLLFKLPDKQNKWYYDKLLRQIGPAAAGFVMVGVLLAAGVPQGLMANMQKNVMDAMKAKPKQSDVKNEDQLPEDMRKEMQEKQKLHDTTTGQIPFFESNYRPEGRIFDYTKQEAKEKVYYPDQKMVVITYKDGSILTYKPAELKGWMKQEGQPVMITANNELIPSPTLPLKLPGNVEAKMNEPGFPAWMFPEYGTAASSSTPAAAPPASPQAPGYNPYGGG